MADASGKGMLSFEGALARIVDVEPIGATERVHLSQAAGRILAEDVNAQLDQPPQAVSSMDGYAVRAEDLKNADKCLEVIGAIAAGDMPGLFSISEGQAARIFTGAPIPVGADSVVIQENVVPQRDDTIMVNGEVTSGAYVRPEGYDFRVGATVLPAQHAMRSSDLSLAAASGRHEVTVLRKPRVAVISTGNELVAPGTIPQPGQIIASNALGVCALVESFGGEPLDLGIARDDMADLKARFEQANKVQADVIVTLGGASVGDHDLVRPALIDLGAQLDFWKVAVRPGKPLMFGKLGQTKLLGLPGNPVSSLVCAHIFLQPLLNALLGLSSVLTMKTGVLASDVSANGPRRHFMRAVRVGQHNGEETIKPLADQDSSLLSALSKADVLINIPPHQAHLSAGAPCQYLLLN
ncbi:MAG: gephyrin-like molybdotransferase Glp [Pseudomonadota bacterium]